LKKYTAVRAGGSFALTRVLEWEKISLVSDPIPDTLSNILIVTNRPFLPDDAERIYFPNAIAEYRKVTYMAENPISARPILNR